MAAAAQGVLLDAAADFVDDLGAHPHHVNVLCRCRHNPFYADVLVMPMSAGILCSGWDAELVRSA
jgi:hypothetical protein